MSLKTLEAILSSGKKLTPMMEQYYSIKKEFPDTLLLFRMGDFYELFFDDAIEAAKLLNITLTHRGKIDDVPIPMSGIPHHAANTYIDRITSRGLKAAICEQIEDPKDAVGIVKRAVTQIVSPGMPYDLEKTKAKEHNYMASGSFHNGKFHLVLIDFTTGDFVGHKLKSEEEFVDKLRIFSPKEIITCMGQWEDFPKITHYLEHAGILKTHLSQEYFDSKYSSIYIDKIIPFYKKDSIIALDKNILSPIGALAYYISSTQMIEKFHHIRPFRMTEEKGLLKVTLSTLSGLEIIPKTRESYNDSLLGFFDRTKTALGSRNLRKVFTSPLADEKKISKRQNIIEYLINNIDILKNLREDLSNVRDIERILAKVSSKKINSSDLLNISESIKSYININKGLKDISKKLIDFLTPEEKKEIKTLSNLIGKTINDEIGASLEKGNLINPGYSKERDKLSDLNKNRSDELLKIEAKYRKKTGIPNLRLKSNNVAGFFIEVSKSHLKKVPKNFERKQTLVNSERFLTSELIEFEKEVTIARGKLEQLESEIFKKIVNNVSKKSQLLLKMAGLIADIDVFASLTWVALEEEFTKPTISSDKKIIDIKGGWHPLIKSKIKDLFITHNLLLDEDKYFGLITGPNMAGKTTVIREIAIIQFLSQIGSFVPAHSATVGLCDYLFSRLGASDDILKGQSTFMVEMTETAEILRHATDRSLIILDEVGRGTSTYDGLSIAWSLVEHFVKKTKALTLFATHYHELIDVVDNLDSAKNLTVETQNNKGEVQFLYRLIEQGASQSFGIYVAKLAGLPRSVLKRSENILKSLEEENSKEDKTQMDFFDIMPEEHAIPTHLQKLEDEVSDLDLLNMTPLEAINKLHEMKKHLTIQ